MSTSTDVPESPLLVCISPLQGYEQPNAYIASQGPVPAAFPDFWRMIWEYDVPTIVMVTNLKEDEKVKLR